ncbi:sodium-dependent transporter [Brevibacillus laterosporus]|uniref:Transporter n=1 Tax=Brevibacillus laterosporus TaxID=1465 RepID=A0AAP3DDG1_BRELA|nr:sodium-dependent transporter [Brevibacillus laterosporus]ATO50630.1 hypothetical protein BrL25_16920 [Brevibacillus laterosporus DSM 25]AYB39170.1 sodium-dependent transporter [Brevibacillus laterosporus]MBG9775136.1 hypothetical protein [Brevibacillus laterosporus]MBG9800267.1 hypothetical protein [Brevibacillus laterosporus]MBG9801981.1 hypothetical protein [Brevibacillus laterosporus]
MSHQSEQWTSRIGFILAAAGSAIGLGAIWKFPYVAGTSGGGIFFLLFLFFTLLIGLPLLLCEFVIGRSTGKEAVSAYRELAPGTKWYFLGIMGVITCFLLFSFYSVVGGWILLYLGMAVTGNLSHPNMNYEQLFGQVISEPYIALIAQFIFIVLTIIIIARGVQNGIEKANKYMFPALFVLFIVLMGRALTLPGAWEGIVFFLKPDVSKIESSTILAAMGQSFFALSLGASAMATYTSYLDKSVSLTRSAVSIVSLNLLISLLAGLAIFPAVFALGFTPTQGPGLLFHVLPAVFSQIPLGGFFLACFLALFFFATITSAFSLLEITVASLTRKDPSKRRRYSWIAGMGVFVLGIPSCLSFGIWSDKLIFGKSIFEAADYLVSNMLLPLGALLISLFVSMKMKRELLQAEFVRGSKLATSFFGIWFILVRYVLPFLIILVFLNTLGIVRFS